MGERRIPRVIVILLPPSIFFSFRKKKKKEKFNELGRLGYIVWLGVNQDRWCASCTPWICGINCRGRETSKSYNPRKDLDIIAREGRKRRKDSSPRDAGVTILLKVYWRSFIVFDDNSRFWRLIEKIIFEESKSIMYMYIDMLKYVELIGKCGAKEKMIF